MIIIINKTQTLSVERVALISFTVIHAFCRLAQTLKFSMNGHVVERPCCGRFVI